MRVPSVLVTVKLASSSTRCSSVSTRMRVEAVLVLSATTLYEARSHGASLSVNGTCAPAYA
jgi:hypothetical protein